MSTPWANLGLDEATEADLIAAKSAAPAQTHEIDALIKILRASKAAEAAQPAPPIEVRIVNAEELAPKDTILKVERDSSGKLTGAVAHKI